MLTTLIAIGIFAPPIGPTLPPRCTAEILSINHSVQVAISKGEFVEAQKLLNKWPLKEIGYSIEGEAPEGAADAESMAVKLWLDESGGLIHFVRSETPRVRLKFVDSGITNAPPSTLENGVWTAEVPLFISNAKRKNSTRGISMAIAKAMGNSIGLASNDRPSYVMGYDDFTQLSQPIDMKAAERKVLARILSTRKTLEEAIEQKQILIPAEPKMEILPKEFDAGNVKSGDLKKNWFAVKNDGNATLEFETHATCSCVVLGEMREVAPGKVLALEIGIDTRTMLGTVEKIVNFYSNAHENTVQEITLRAKAFPEFRIVPDEAQRVVLDEAKPTVKEFYFYNMPLYPILITGASTNRPDVKVELVPYVGNIFDPAFDKVPTRRVGTLIRLTFPTTHPAGQDWTRLTVETDSLRLPKVEISIQTLKGMTVQPASVYFGGVTPGEPALRSVSISHPATPFKILSMKVEGPFTAEYAPWVNNPLGYKINVTYVGKEKGLLKGVLEIRTDHPRYPVVKIPISGSAN